MFSPWRNHMEQEKKALKAKMKKPAAGEAKPKGKNDLGPCEKAFHPETARLKDSDEACDDGVR
jgi:hypothetical protein